MNRRTRVTVFAAAALAIGSHATGATINVPSPGISTIQQAIDMASGGDEIVVAPGTWSGFTIEFTPVPLTIRSQAPTNPDIVLATVVDSVVVLNFEQTTLLGLTFTASIASNDSTLTIENCSFDRAGLDIRAPFSIVIRDTIFTNGDSIGITGAGAISVIGTAGSGLTLVDCAFYQTQGSAVISGSELNLTATRCTFSGNVCTSVIEAGFAGTVLLDRCVISGNEGRGVMLTAVDNALLESCVITGNKTSGDGGGVQVSGPVGSFVELRKCLIQANTAASAGGVSGDLTATAGISTICGNVPDQVSGSASGVLRTGDVCPPPQPIGCLPDLDGSGSVGFADLSILLAAWGACPC